MKLRIKNSINNECSWAKDMAGQILELNEEDKINIGPRPNLGVKMGAYIKLKHLELIEYDNTEECQCICPYLKKLLKKNL